MYHTVRTLPLPIQFPHLNWQFVQQFKPKFRGLRKSSLSPCRICNIQTSKPPARKPPPILMTELSGAQFWAHRRFPPPGKWGLQQQQQALIPKKKGQNWQKTSPLSRFVFQVFRTFFAESTRVRSVKKFLFSLLKAGRKMMRPLLAFVICSSLSISRGSASL